MKFLNRGGKRMDIANSQKKATVGIHIINENSQDPVNLEKETVNSTKLGHTKLLGQVQSSNVPLFNHLRSASDLKQFASKYDRQGKSSPSGFDT